MSPSSIAGLAFCRPRPCPCSPAVDSTLRHVNGFLNKDAQTNIQGTLLGARASTEALQKLIVANQANINQITRNLAQMSAALNKTTGKLDRIAANFGQLSDSLKAAPGGPGPAPPQRHPGRCPDHREQPQHGPQRPERLDGQAPATTPRSTTT